jgi:hypothetical protein
MAGKAGRRRLPRRSIEETRLLMLTAATSLVCAGTRDTGDSAIAAALAHVRVKDVAEEATRMVRAETGDENAPAITIGSIYQVWPSQAEFQADLLFHIAELHAALVPGVPESIQIFRDAVAAGVPVEEVVRRVLDQNHRYMRENPIFRVVLSFYPSAGNTRVREALGRLEESFMKAACEAWQALLDAYGLRVRPPYQLEHLAGSVEASLLGFHMRWISQPDSLGDPKDEEGWSLVTRSAVMLFTQFTEPAPSP